MLIKLKIIKKLTMKIGPRIALETFASWGRNWSKNENRTESYEERADSIV
jgi:hypothetical protein